MSDWAEFDPETGNYAFSEDSSNEAAISEDSSNEAAIPAQTPGPIVKLLTRVVVGFVAIYVLFVAVYYFSGVANGGCC